MYCEYCGEKITLIQRLIGKTAVHAQIDSGTWKRLHDHCYIILRMEVHFELLFKSQAEILKNTKNIEENQEAHAEITALSLEASRASFDWLVKNCPTKDMFNNIGVFDPILLELILKYTGMKPEDLVAQIKNKELKRVLNNLKAEKSK